MKDGVDREGDHLYPAFPYDHFTKVTNDDIDAIYAYLMSAVEPVKEETRKNELGFPFNIRTGLYVWKALFLDRPVEARPVKGRGMEQRRVSGRRARPLRRVPYAAQFPGRGDEPGLWRRQRRGLVRATDQQDSISQLPWTKLQLVNYLMDG